MSVQKSRATTARAIGVAGMWMIGAAIPATSVSAQRTVPDSTPDALPTVHVSVLRTPFDQTNAPFAVAAVTVRDAAAARPGFALDEVLDGVAGIQVDNRLNFALGEHIAIRGIGARAQFGVRGIRVIVDGIPATLPDGQTQLNNVDLGSIGRAEVVRGPVSALYGNASGGVIQLQSAFPTTGAFVPTVYLLRGSDGLMRVQGGAGGAIGQLTYVVNADRLDYHGYRAFSDARNAHLNSVATYNWDRAQVAVVANAVQYNAQNPGALSDSLLQVDRRQAFSTNVAQRTGERGKQVQGGISTHLQLGVGELRFSGYLARRALDNPIPPRIIALERAVGGARAAYAVTVGDSARSLTTLVGAESEIQRDDRRNYTNMRGTAGVLTLDQRERVGSASPFAQLTAAYGAITLLGGLRYDHFRFAAADHLITSTDPNDSGVRTMSALSPLVGVTYRVVPTLHAYANVANGFQTPTTTELANRPSGAGGFNPTLQSEHLRSAEGGVNGLFAGRVTYHLDAYHMCVTDELIPFELASFPGRQFYRNAGTTRHRGMELDLGATIRPDVSARASYAYVDARYLRYTVDTTSYAGHRVPGIVPHLLTLGVDFGPTDGPFLGVEARVQSSMPVDDANRAHSPGYLIAALRGELPISPGVVLVGGVGNLLNARYNTSVVINAAGERYFEPAAPRTVYLGVRWGAWP